MRGFLASTVLVASLAGLLVSLTVVPSTAPYSVFDTGPRGYSVITSNATLHLQLPTGLSRGDAVLIPLEEPLSLRDAYRIGSLLASGATVVVLDEEGFSNTLYRVLGLGVRVVNATVYDLVYNYGDRLHPRARCLGVSSCSLPLYMPSYIEAEGPGVRVLAVTSPFSYADVDGDGYYSLGDPVGEFPVVVEARVGGGRLVVVSDLDAVSNWALGEAGGLEALRVLVHGGRLHLVVGYLGLGVLDRVRLYVNLALTPVLSGGDRILAAYILMLLVAWVAGRYVEGEG